MAAVPPPPTPGPTPGPFVVVANSSATDAGCGRLQTALDALQAAGRAVQVLRTRRGHHVPALARRAAVLAQQQQGTLIAAGGDGTVNAVARAALAAGRPFGVLPLGHRNDFARMHDLPSEPQEAARVWLSGHTDAVQLGLVNGRPFLVHASLGRSAERLRTPPGEHAAPARSPWQALQGWIDRARLLRLVTVTAHRVRFLRTPALLVGNSPLLLARLGLLADDVGRGQLAALAPPPGTPDSTAPWSAEHFEHMTVNLPGAFARTRIRVACDGEWRWLRAPLHFAVALRALPLLAPVRP